MNGVSKAKRKSTSDNRDEKRTYPHSSGDRSAQHTHTLKKKRFTGGVQRQPNLDVPDESEKKRR